MEMPQEGVWGVWLQARTGGLGCGLWRTVGTRLLRACHTHGSDVLTVTMFVPSGAFSFLHFLECVPL